MVDQHPVAIDRAGSVERDHLADRDPPIRPGRRDRRIVDDDLQPGAPDAVRNARVVAHLQTDAVGPGRSNACSTARPDAVDPSPKSQA